MNQKTSYNGGNAVSNVNTSFQNAHGLIPYGMTNDYMFRAVLQTNNKALRGLICSLLHLKQEDVLSVEVTNPVILGESVKNKEFRLDINVTLNNHTFINLEMQVAGKLSWNNRSVSYLCRSFDMLNHGQDYRKAGPVIHIGFLDYTLFEDCPEFYAIHKLLNVKNHHIYSDNLTLSVVDLSQIEMATEEDKKYRIDYWARLFKATTWEEIKMLAAEDQYINEASETIFRLSADEQIRKRCLDREEYYLDIQAYESIIEENKQIIAEDKQVIAENKRIIANDKEIISNAQKVIAENESEIERLHSLLKQHGIDYEE